MKSQKVHFECSLSYFNGTWLNKNISDYNVDLPSFTLIQCCVRLTVQGMEQSKAKLLGLIKDFINTFVTNSTKREMDKPLSLFKEREHNPRVVTKPKCQSKRSKSLKHTTKKVGNNRNMGAGRLKN